MPFPDVYNMEDWGTQATNYRQSRPSVTSSICEYSTWYDKRDLWDSKHLEMVTISSSMNSWEGSVLSWVLILRKQRNMGRENTQPGKMRLNCAPWTWIPAIWRGNEPCFLRTKLYKNLCFWIFLHWKWQSSKIVLFDVTKFMEICYNHRKK